MPLRAIAHVCLKTTHLAATEQFYVGLLGLTKQFEFTRRGQVIGFYLRLADRVFIEAFLSSNPPPSDPGHCLSHFCLETDDLAALHARLTAAGVPAGPIKTGADATLQFWAPDPNGVAIEFQQYTDRSAQFSTADVEVDW